VASAARLFAEDGYARTTMAKIAADAGVSAETVQLHGPKSALMRAAVEYATFGVPYAQNILDVDVGKRFLAIEDRAEAMAFFAATAADIHHRTAPIGLALNGAAAADPELDRYFKELTASITVQIGRLLEAIRDRGWLRQDVPFDELVATAAVLCSFETYLRLTERGGWTLDRYRAWCTRMVTEALLA
jgi:AcrR family transcriptional regulator